MCARFTFLSYDEVADVIRELRLTSVPNPLPDWPAVHPSAYPNLPVTIMRPAATPTDGFGMPQLEPATLTWGFTAEWNRDVIFNTRIESAGKPFWRDSLARRRCLVPCFGFFEPHQSETTPSPRTGRPIKRQYYFTDPGGALLLLGGLWKDDRFSILTTTPNTAVAPIHGRMPLVIVPEEVPQWLTGDYLQLADRSAVSLEVRPE